jgi:hypothetical protein
MTLHGWLLTAVFVVAVGVTISHSAPTWPGSSPVNTHPDSPGGDAARADAFDGEHPLRLLTPSVQNAGFPI